MASLVSLNKLLWVSAFCFLLRSIPLSAQSVSEFDVKDCVIILHGMGRTAHSMRKIETNLQASGYMVWNKGYPSLSERIESLSQQTLDLAISYCREQRAKQIHAVTHSLGGILLRHYLQENEIEELGRIVMLSPPNHGSEIVNKYRDNWLFRAAMGPAFLQLGTDGIVQTLKPIPGAIGIIAGNESSDPWFSKSIPGPDDGKVSVESTRLDEMADFLVVPVGHTFIMNNDKVIEQIQHFLLQAAFQHEGMGVN